jgi:hypothetical protein
VVWAPFVTLSRRGFSARTHDYICDKVLKVRTKCGIRKVTSQHGHAHRPPAAGVKKGAPQGPKLELLLWTLKPESHSNYIGTNAI